MDAIFEILMTLDREDGYEIHSGAWLKVTWFMRLCGTSDRDVEVLEGTNDLASVRDLHGNCQVRES